MLVNIMRYVTKHKNASSSKPRLNAEATATAAALTAAVRAHLPIRPPAFTAPSEPALTIIADEHETDTALLAYRLDGSKQAPLNIPGSHPQD